MAERQRGDEPDAEQRKRVVRRRRDMDFTPVRNGMDFLLSAFDHLSQREGVPGARDLKYAVLHLQAAVEVLLKARLIREHWSLVFSDPGKAKRVDYEKGSFSSCTVLGAVDRLNNIVNLQITKEQRQAITNLADTRNALTHLGHTASVYAVEAQAALVLDFLLNFIHRELRPALSKEGPFVETTMDQLRTRLLHIKALVSQRSARIEEELKHLVDRTVECPECGQWAIVLGDEPLSCRFCMTEWDAPHELAVWYKEVNSGGEIFPCDSCNHYAVVMRAEVAKNRNASTPICFGCAADYSAWRRCEICNDSLVHPEQSPQVCSDCEPAADEAY